MANPLYRSFALVLRVAGFLLGLAGVVWWQQRQDERLLGQMDDVTDQHTREKP